MSTESNSGFYDIINVFTLPPSSGSCSPDVAKNVLIVPHFVDGRRFSTTFEGSSYPTSSLLYHLGEDRHQRCKLNFHVNSVWLVRILVRDSKLSL